MNTNEIKELFDYNLWANNRLLEAVSQIPTDEYHRDLKTSHGGLHGTLLHIVAAHKIWLSRWVGNPDKALVTDKDVPSRIDLLRLWEEVSTGTANFLAGMTESRLNETYSMTTTAGKTFTHSFLQTMLHLVNHSSIHRGQITAMLRQLGVKPPPIDLIAYYRR